jgi:hypothetical protein
MNIVRILSNTFRLDFQLLDDPLQRRRRAFAAFLLIFMSGQLVLLEGNLLSWPKMIVMAASPVILFSLRVNPFSPGMLYGGLYWLTICMTSLLHPYKVNHMSIWFTVPFILLFGCYDALLKEHVFTRDDFEKILLWVMNAYLLFLILQQLCWLVGIHQIALFNRWKPLGFKFQSLGLEPSYAARLFGAYAFAYLELLRLKHGHKLDPKFLWKNYRWPTIAIVYVLVTLGSGTAWGCLVFLCVLLAWYGNTLLGCLLLMAMLLIPAEQLEARDRFFNTMDAALTMNMDNVREADHSASFRVGVFFAFIEGFKPFSSVFWFGQGHYEWIQPNVGIIQIYGFFAWIVQLVMLRVCAFRRYICFEFIYFLGFMGMCIGNVVNLWAITMVFATLKYCYMRQPRPAPQPL